MTISGIRPDFIRMSEIFKKLDAQFNHILVHTGQHYDEMLSGVFFKELNIRKPDFVLNTGKQHGGTHYHQLGYLSVAIMELINAERLQPDIILFLGDSNTVCAALPLRKEGYVIGHIEAGMRSFDKRMLEEINRTVCDHCSHIHFVYNDEYKTFLERENIRDHVHVVGNTIVEVCRPFVPKEPKRNDLILIDIHRPENFKYEARLATILQYANRCAEKYGLPVKILQFGRTFQHLEGFGLSLGRVEAVPLMAYAEYLRTVYHSRFIITDSGTGQEEPALLGTPAIVPRDCTERPQSVESHCSYMLDVNSTGGFDASWAWIAQLESKSLVPDVAWLGDGTTSEAITQHLKHFLEVPRVQTQT
jgi:UDP-N-acetylglucosamine 2-epimerase (non-hydrolysing)